MSINTRATEAKGKDHIADRKLQALHAHNPCKGVSLSDEKIAHLTLPLNSPVLNKFTI